MSGRFVRASKYRHVFGRPSKREQCYDNLHITKNAWDTNLVKANPEYISVNWEASGGGAFAVIPINERGKLPDLIPLFRGHTAAVLDTDWNPFDDRFLASASDDGKVLLWRVPDDFTVRLSPEELQDVNPVSKLTGHSRKVGHVLFNPSASSVLASSSGDYTVKLWDVESGTAPLTLKHADIVQSLSWSANGALLVTTCRDKKLRVWDTRQQKAVVETAGHSGGKNSRAVWMGEHDRVATTGFSKMSDRQLGLWDIRAASAPVEGFTILDQISGVCMPFWDEGNQMLYLAGKGDGNIRYYEYTSSRFEYLSQHTALDPQRGIAFLPKRGVSTHDNEIARAFRTVNEGMIEPVAFIVPRRAEVFQDDIYPPATGLKPAMSAKEWFAGDEAKVPPKISMESLFEGHAPEEVVSARPSASATPLRSATPQPVVAAKAEPSPPQPAAAHVPVAAARGPAPAMKDNQASIASMASRFADNEESSSDDDTSSFEETSKSSRTSASAPTPVAAIPPTTTSSAPAPQSQTLPATSTATSSSSTSASTAPIATTSSAPSAGITNPSADSSSDTSAPQRAASSGGAAEGLRAILADIKGTLESQARLIAAQGEQLEALALEVAGLKGGAGTGT